MRMPAAGKRTARDGGFIIVVVLWIMMALATLASIYAAYVVRTAYVVGPSDDRVSAEALFTAALELTVYQVTAVEKEKRPSNGRSNFRLGRATISLEFHSEAGRVDLNTAPKALLANLFANLGAKPGDADEFADRVIAWRTPAGHGAAGPEGEAYRKAGRSYTPRHGLFQDVGELWLVLGLPPAMVERVLPYVTVFSGVPQINIMDASPLVLAALGPGQSAATVDPGPSIRVSVGLRFDNGTRANAEIVIVLTDDADEPYRILSWRDDFDQISPARG